MILALLAVWMVAQSATDADREEMEAACRLSAEAGDWQVQLRHSFGSQWFSQSTLYYDYLHRPSGLAFWRNDPFEQEERFGFELNALIAGIWPQVYNLPSEMDPSYGGTRLYQGVFEIAVSDAEGWAWARAGQLMYVRPPQGGGEYHYLIAPEDGTGEVGVLLDHLGTHGSSGGVLTVRFTAADAEARTLASFPLDLANFSDLVARSPGLLEELTETCFIALAHLPYEGDE
ncbi:hypothetical protein [Maricaulis sp.]|uniref:hypothetical protein n=1 Tax=Maricaulis sp. TaxID=1486257 RepID=UPI002614A83F|nr:hypothetical protein [Maricaulis sp.]